VIAQRQPHYTAWRNGSNRFCLDLLDQVTTSCNLSCCQGINSPRVTCLNVYSSLLLNSNRPCDTMVYTMVDVASLHLDHVDQPAFS
jgi:hypothetical protein